jgi:hypothetical protein
MSVSPDAYRTQLDDNMVQFYLILERYKQAFIVAQASGNYPNDSQFQAAKSLLESRFRDLFIVESQVLGGIDGNNAEIVSLNDRIAMVEGIYNGENAALQQKKAEGLASGPLAKQTDQELIMQYIGLLYYIGGACLGANFLYQKLKR